MGGWRDVMDEGLTQAAFSEKMTELIAMAEHDWILEALGESGIRPVGLILASNVARGKMRCLISRSKCFK